MTVRILGINSSPHKNGATASIIERILQECSLRGAEVDLIHLFDYRILPCEGCLEEGQKECNPERCLSIKDDFEKIVNKMLDADGIVFGSPVYWYGVNGPMKNLVDRLTSFENIKRYFDGKVAAFVASAGEDGATSAIVQMMIAMNHMGFIILPYGTTYIIGKKKVFEDLETVLYCKRIAVNMIKLVKAVKDYSWWEVD